MYESKIKSEKIDRLFETILCLQSVEECYRFFDDLCSFGEIQAMSQRLEVAKMLREGKTYSEIADETGGSSTTITRVNKCVSYGSNGYQMVLDRCEKK